MTLERESFLDLNRIMHFFKVVLEKTEIKRTGVFVPTRKMASLANEDSFFLVSTFFGQWTWLTIENTVTKNLGIQISLRVPDFSSLTYITRDGIAILYYTAILLFIFWGSSTLFSIAAIYHPQCTRNPICLYLCQLLIFYLVGCLFTLTATILMGMKWELIVVLTSIFLQISLLNYFYPKVWEDDINKIRF